MFDVVINAAPLFAEAALGTLLYSIVALMLGFPLGIIVATGAFSKRFYIRGVSRLFVSFFRSVPLLVLLLIAYYALPSIGLNTTAPQAAILSLVLVEAAYLGEVLRGGLLAMPQGQIEAAKMAGLTPWQTTRHITLPNVFRLTLPSLVNEGTMAVKASSLVSVVGILELTRVSQNLAASTFKPLEIYLAAGIIYLFINIVVIWAGGIAEKRLSKGFN